MKRREQALLFLRKAAQDESLLDAVLESGDIAMKMLACATSGPPKRS